MKGNQFNQVVALLSEVEKDTHATGAQTAQKLALTVLACGAGYLFHAFGKSIKESDRGILKADKTGIQVAFEKNAHRKDRAFV